jgi:hypothetical protein
MQTVISIACVASPIAVAIGISFAITAALLRVVAQRVRP